jgi:ribosomal protein L16 Arg81 hydroxylase
LQPNRRNTSRAIPRLKSAELTRELREGATLVLDNVDELYRPIRRVAESLERIFRVRIQVNSYSGWRSSHGFDVHWDDHDVFVLQVAGSKHWKIYGATRRYPLARDVELADNAPTEILWEQTLRNGDLLYIPRGWWHVATPLDEPTLHLTVGVGNPTGLIFCRGSSTSCVRQRSSAKTSRTCADAPRHKHTLNVSGKQF